MEPATIIASASALINIINQVSSIDFEESAVLQELIDNIFGAFASNERTCVSNKYACKFRDGSCHVLLNKGQNWQIEDINTCTYRQQIKD